MGETSSSDPEGDLVRAWSDAYSRGVLAHSRPSEVSNAEVFADVYHSLAHSATPAADAMLRLEHSNAEAVAAKCHQRDKALVSDNIWGVSLMVVPCLFVL